MKRRLPDAIAMLWIVAMSGLYLAPAFKDGTDFGPADIGANMSLLTMRAFHGTYYNNLDSDIITQYQPWAIFNWNEVHHGIFPMWNYLVGTGLPQFLNFQSAPLSLSAIVGYAFPIDESLFVGVAVKLFLAGLGVYVAARVMRMSTLPSLFSATTFMLSGSFSGWLGWSISGPLSWSGWILAGCILAYRRWAHGGTVAFLALATAFSVYAGFPETSLLLALGLGSVLAATAAATGRKDLSRLGCVRVGMGALAGIGLSAPLLVPGVYVLHASARAASLQGSGISINLATLLLARGYYGLPLRGSVAWANYYETTAYVGILAVLFALIAVWRCREKATVIGLTVGAIVSFLTIYHFGRSGPVQWALDRMGLSQVALQRMLPFLALCISLLAGFGIDHMLSHWNREFLKRCLTPVTFLLALVIGILWLFAIGMGMPKPNDPLFRGLSAVPLSFLRSVREQSLYWPSAEVGLVIAWLFLSRRSFRADKMSSRARYLTTAVILVLQAAFLLAAGIGLNTYSQELYPNNLQIAQLTAIVGSSRLGLDSGNRGCSRDEIARGEDCGVRLWLKDGFYPESNIAYRIDELGMHDPVIPKSLIAGWPVVDAGQKVDAALTFVPDIDTVGLARMYGVGYVLAAPGQRPPSGMKPVWHSSSGTLFAVPKSEIFSVAVPDAGGSVLSVHRVGDSTYTLTVRARRRVTIDAAITWYPGWHGEIDGKALSVTETGRGLMRFVVPPGSSTVELQYWPEGMTTGIGVAGSSVGIFGLAIGCAEYRRRRARRKKKF